MEEHIGLGRDFEVIIWGASYKEWGHFYGGGWPLKTSCKDFKLTVGGGLGLIKKWSREKFIFHAIIPALYTLWWKFYWLSESTFIFSMLESQSWKNKLLTKMWSLKDLSKFLTITITSFKFLNSLVKL